MVAPASEAAADVEDLAARFAADGFVTARLLDPDQTEVVHTYAVGWLHCLMREANGGHALPGPIMCYHRWQPQTAINHDAMLKAPNRHRRPQGQVAEALLNERFWALLKGVAPDSKLSIWDEGLGWLAFRLIRPGHGDGYPWSCKAWGPARSVLSIWIPVIGHSAQETIALWPGSQRLHLESYLPSESKFTKDERRLLVDPPLEAIKRPELAPGEAVIFGPRTIHSEDVTDSPITRLNLEIRVEATDQRQNRAGQTP